MWPYIGDYVQELLMTSVQKTVQDSASVMGSFKFVHIDLGDIVCIVKFLLIICLEKVYYRPCV